jgi:hypothetical protein
VLKVGLFKNLLIVVSS